MTARSRFLSATVVSAATIAALVAGSAAGALASEPPLYGVSPAPAMPQDRWAAAAPSLQDATGRVDVFVQTAETGALQAQQQAEESGRSFGQTAPSVDAQVDSTNTHVDDITAQAKSLDDGAQVLYSAAYSVPGVAISADIDTIKAIAARDDVLKVSRIVTRTLDLPDASADPANANSDAFTRAVDAWTQTGATGQGVNVAVIDTGLDYTHSDFGGPGTTDAYQAALASTDAPNPAWYDAAKYLGGWDFAGTTYNGAAGTSAYQPVPHPDANPIDGRGGNHGTHVAGTAAGYGVSADGTTFRGDYGTISPESLTSQFKVGPGSAPRAGLYSLKVFGDGGGSTSLAGAAIEWVAKEVAKGTKIDVVNLSLGSSGGSVDDPDNAKLDALMDAGVLPVIAAGNSGDVTDIAGSPGTTERALAVAASSSGRGFADAIAAYQGDPATTGPKNYMAQYSQDYTGSIDVTAPVVALNDQSNLNGCASFSPADSARVKGKIVWLGWDDKNVACGSAVRFENAGAAGAVGVLLESQLSSFEAGIAGTSAVPGAQLSADAVTALRPILDRGALTVSLKSEFKQSVGFADSSRVDTLASFSSRGTHGSIDNVLKPDVAAPGVGIISAGNSTGNGTAQMSGTSMASPHTAGIAALVAQRHPDWSPDRIKQQIMNTAVHTVTTGGPSPIAYGPARAGGGRVDALSAVTNDASVTSVENGHLVSASFGVIEAGTDAVTQTRTIRLSNEASAERTYRVVYSPRTQTPGVTYSLSVNQITVPAGGVADLILTLSIPDPTALRRTLDPTSVATQGGLARQYLADASGVIDFTTQNASAMRLSVYAAPKPVSNTAVSSILYNGDSGSMTVTGRGVSQGDGREQYTSLMVPLQMGATDPNDTFPAGTAVHSLESADILAVGASTTAPQLEDPSQGILTIGVAMDGNWASLLGLTYPVVNFDVNADKRVDFTTIVRQAADGVDEPIAVTIDAVTGVVRDQRPVNNLYGDHGTNVFDNNVLAIPVSLAALGYTPDTTQLNVTYQVQTRSYYAPGFTGGGDSLVDETTAATINVYHPDIWFGDPSGTGSVAFADQAGTLPVHRAPGATSQALILHLQAGNGRRYQILTPQEQTTPGTIATPTPPAPSKPTFSSGVTSGAGSTKPARGPLADTGMDAPVMAALAVSGGLILTGIVGLLWRRRRARIEGE